jgi:hypothetical protein
MSVYLPRGLPKIYSPSHSPSPLPLNIHLLLSPSTSPSSVYLNTLYMAQSSAKKSGRVVGKSVSHHHRHSAWQRTELQQVLGDTWMMETDWATGYRDTGVAELDRVTGSIHSGDSGVDSLHRILYLVSYHHISSHLIIHRITHSSFRMG